MTALRSNRRRAEELAEAIEEAREYLHHAKADPSCDREDIQALKEDLYDLEHALFLTGYVPESEQ